MEIKQLICESVTEAFLDGMDRKNRNPVSSSTLFSWAATAILKVFGEDWLDAGWIDINFVHPVFPGDVIATRLFKRPNMIPNGPGGLVLEVVMVNQDNLICASGWVGMGVNVAWLPMKPHHVGVSSPTPAAAGRPKGPTKFHAPKMAISIAATSASSDDDENVATSSSSSSSSSEQVEELGPAPSNGFVDDDADEVNAVVDMSSHGLSTSSTSSSLALPPPPPVPFNVRNGMIPSGGGKSAILKSSSSSVSAPQPQQPLLSPQAPLPPPASHNPHPSPSHPAAAAPSPLGTSSLPLARLHFPLMPILKDVSPQAMEILPKSFFIAPPKAKDYVRFEAKDLHNSLWFRSANPPVHPGWIVDQMAQLIQHSNRRLPLLYTNIKLQFFSRLVSAQRVTTTGHFRRAYDHKNNHVCVVDGSLLGEQGQRVAQMQHTSIFQVRSAL
jgi:hypothetical protein